MRFLCERQCITVMRNAIIPSVRTCLDHKYSRSAVYSVSQLRDSALVLRHLLQFSVFPFRQGRGVKSIAKTRIHDLPTKASLSKGGPLQNGVDGLVYPTVVQQARNNMRQFDKCVLLTRIGNFYEVSLDAIYKPECIHP